MECTLCGLWTGWSRLEHRVDVSSPYNCKHPRAGSGPPARRGRQTEVLDGVSPEATETGGLVERTTWAETWAPLQISLV